MATITVKDGTEINLRRRRLSFPDMAHQLPPNRRSRTERFRRPVILAWPARIAWPRWTMIPYLALAVFQSLPLAAILTFSDRVIYAGYSSLDDQALAGVIMWVPGSLPLLVPMLRLTVELSSRPAAIAGDHV